MQTYLEKIIARCLVIFLAISFGIDLSAIQMAIDSGEYILLLLMVPIEIFICWVAYGTILVIAREDKQ